MGLGAILGALRKWPFHPKYFGLLTAFVFFALALGLVPYEAAGAPEQALFFTAVRTLFAFVGGAGFTAWLSMSIYEYIGERTQERAWNREFAVRMVTEVYGPIYDDLRRNLDRTRVHLAAFKLSAGSYFETKYLSLLAPSTLMEKGVRLLGVVADHNRMLDRGLGKAQGIVIRFTENYLRSLGILSEERVATGAEARYILGATEPSFKENYDRFLRELEKILAEHTLSGDIGKFDKELRETVLRSPEAKDDRRE